VQQAKEQVQVHHRKRGVVKYAVAVAIIVVIIGVAIFAGSILSQGQSSSFGVFRSNFNSAPRVAIFVTAYNGTIFTGTLGCATSVIQEIVASRTNHRNSSTIDFNVLNQSTCTRSKGLSTQGTNYTTTSVQNCLNISGTEPTLFINYSTSANTTIIKPDYLYIAGDAQFLRQCGIADQIS
jgi:hypothetical protein